MQLVAYGAQDIYLTGNPQITFFKVVYRRHTNFSMEAIQQTWSGQSTASANGRCTTTISRNGDLVHRMYLEFVISGAAANDRDNATAAAITNIELEIGGQKIDKHSGQWLETWAELTEKNPSGATMESNAQATGTLFQKMSGMGGCTSFGSVSLADGTYHVPLQFWFCRNPGLALPLIALQYHEVKVILDHVMNTALPATSTCDLWCDYIYLDTDERRRFAQVSHEYLIEQVQEQSVTSSSSADQDLNFNHPVKVLIMSALAGAIETGISLVTPFNVSGGTMGLKLNGHERFAPRNVNYFTRTQVWQHFSGAGGLDSSGAAKNSGGFADGIAVYSFALKPEEHQPSGTCNFSRIDNAVLTTSLARASNTINIYAVNYNVLRIMSGMGGLAYSN